MREVKYVVRDPLGVHARPAGQLVKTVSGFASSVTLLCNGGTADAKRLMAVMRLSIKNGMEMVFRIEGEDEAQVEPALKAFLERNL